MNAILNSQIEQFVSSKIAGGRSPITIREYRPPITGFFTIVGKSDIKDVTLEDINRYKQTVKNDGDLLYNLSVAAVRSFLEWAFQNDLIETNLGLKIPKRRIQKRPMEEFVWLTLREQERIINACTTMEERIVLMFPLKTGCRNGRYSPVKREFCGIEWPDFDFERKMVKIYGKGPGIEGMPRYPHFDNELKDLLLRYKKAEGKMPVNKNPHDNATIVREVAGRIGLTKLVKCTHPFHALKHSFCSTWVIMRRAKNISEDLRGLSRQVGTGIDVLEIYIHIAEDYLKSSYEETMQIISEMGPNHEGQTA